MYYIVSYDTYLAHHGIKGQHWGIRRYQNEDGTLTEAGKKKYRMTRDEYLNKIEKYRKVAKVANKVSAVATLGAMGAGAVGLVKSGQIQGKINGNKADIKTWTKEKEAYSTNYAYYSKPEVAKEYAMRAKELAKQNVNKDDFTKYLTRKLADGTTKKVPWKFDKQGYEKALRDYGINYMNQYKSEVEAFKINSNIRGTSITAAQNAIKVLEGQRNKPLYVALATSAVAVGAKVVENHYNKKIEDLAAHWEDSNKK